MRRISVGFAALSLLTVVAGSATASLIQYSGSLDGDVPMHGEVSSAGKFNDPAMASFFFFSGHAGDIVSLTVTRLEMDLDPALWLFDGMLGDDDGFDSIDFVQQGFLGFADDEIVVDSGPFGDPQLLNYVLPSTGAYTVIVSNFASGLDHGGDGMFEFAIECEGCTGLKEEGPVEEPEPEKPVAVVTPATIALFGLGMVGLVAARRRRH